MATCGQTLHPMTRAMGQANDAAPWQCMAYTRIGGLKAGQGCLERRVGMLGQCEKKRGLGFVMCTRGKQAAIVC